MITLVLGVRRVRDWGIPLWAGVLAYELYIYGVCSIGAIYSIFLLGFVAVAGFSIYTIVGLLSSVIATWFQQSVNPKIPRLWIAVFFLLITVVFAMIWLGQVMTTNQTGIVDRGHLIYVFDFMVILPAFAITAVKLFQKQAFGDVLAGMMLIKFDSRVLRLP